VVSVSTHQLLARDLLQLAQLDVDRAANLAEARKELDLARELMARLAADPTAYAMALQRAALLRDDAELRAAEGDRSHFDELVEQSGKIMIDFARAQAAREPELIVWRRETARHLLSLADSYIVGRRVKESEVASREVLAIHQALSEKEPASTAWLEGQAVALSALARTHALARQSREQLDDLTRVVAIRERLAGLEPRRPGRLKDLAEAYKSTVGPYRIVGPPEAAEAAFRKRFEVLGRLHELDPAEPWGEILPRNPVGVLDRDARNDSRLQQLNYARRAVDTDETLVSIFGGASRISESIEGYLTLVGALDPESPAGHREARRALGRVRRYLELLQKAGQLHPVQEPLLVKVRGALAGLPDEPPPVELDEAARRALEGLDYGELADRLLAQERSKDLLIVFDSEARAAEKIPWLATRLEDLSLEPRRVEALISSAFEREKAVPLALPVRLELATLARVIGDLSAARRLDPAVFEAAPDSRLVLRLSQRMAAANRHREAARAIRELAGDAKGPPDLPNLNSLAVSELSSGQFGPAETTLNRALALAPDDPVSLAFRGWLLNGRRQFTQSTPLLRSILDGPQGRIPAIRKLARNQLAGALLELGDLDGAEEQLRFLQAENPGDPGVAYMAAYLLAERGRDLEAAESAARKLLEPNAAFAPIQALLGWILTRRGRAAEGLPLLERAGRSELFAFDPVLFEFLGDAHLQLGHPAQAGAAWRDSLALIPRTAAPDDRRRRSVEEKLRALDTPSPAAGIGRRAPGR
jgi:Tfp pilus assembly protein PilF